jgi:hypothetical protein
MDEFLLGSSPSSSCVRIWVSSCSWTTTPSSSMLARVLVHLLTLVCRHSRNRSSQGSQARPWFTSSPLVWPETRAAGSNRPSHQYHTTISSVTSITDWGTNYTAPKWRGEEWANLHHVRELAEAEDTLQLMFLLGVLSSN